MGGLTTSFKRILAAHDAPRSIATGVAVGVFFGFSPFFGLKTLLAVVVTWMLRGNKLAAAGVVTLHAILLPFLPVLLRLEYDLGYWAESDLHEFPPHLNIFHVDALTWFHWSILFNAGRPILVGSIVLGALLAFLTYLSVYLILTKRNRPL